MPSRILVFDVNETLLDLSALGQPFAEVFGDAAAVQEWFTQLLRLSWLTVITGGYRDFSQLGGAALDMLAAKHGVSLEADGRRRIMDRMKHLPPHQDVEPALSCLRDAGLRLAALTNSAPATAQAQLGNSGLAGYFEQILSVDMAQRYKPAPDPYRAAARKLGVEPAAMRMVAAHDWDIVGAMSAGCTGAFVARGGMLFYPLAEHKPDVIGRDLEDVAAQIIARDG